MTGLRLDCLSMTCNLISGATSILKILSEGAAHLGIRLDDQIQQMVAVSRLVLTPDHETMVAFRTRHDRRAQIAVCPIFSI